MALNLPPLSADESTPYRDLRNQIRKIEGPNIFLAYGGFSDIYKRIWEDPSTDKVTPAGDAVKILQAPVHGDPLIQQRTIKLSNMQVGDAFNVDTKKGTRRNPIKRINPLVRLRLRNKSPTKPMQQVDARGSTVNNIGGDQHNIVNNFIVNNTPSAYVDDLDDNAPALLKPDIDPELNKYHPLIEYGLRVVTSTTTLIMTNIEAAVTFLKEAPETIKSNIASFTVKKMSVRYSFFSDDDLSQSQPQYGCSTPPFPACPVCFHAYP